MQEVSFKEFTGGAWGIPLTRVIFATVGSIEMRMLIYCENNKVWIRNQILIANTPLENYHVTASLYEVRCWLRRYENIRAVLVNGIPYDKSKKLQEARPMDVLDDWDLANLNGNWTHLYKLYNAHIINYLFPISKNNKAIFEAVQACLYCSQVERNEDTAKLICGKIDKEIPRNGIDCRHEIPVWCPLDDFEEVVDRVKNI